MAIAPNKDVKADEGVSRPARKKSGKNFFVIIAIAVVILLTAGGGAYYFLVYKADKTAEVEEKKPAIQIFVPLEVFTVNLKPEASDSQQYLQTVISLQAPSEKDAQALKDRMPEVRNRILFILSAKSASEITSVDGKINLTLEIINELKKPFMGTTSEQNVSGAYFTSFIIQ